MQDLLFALRLLRSRPGFALAAILPLALAIACSTAVLTLVDAVLYRPLGVRDPAGLAAIYGYSRSKAAYLSDSFAEYRDLSSLGEVVESAAAFVRIPLNADLGGGSERLTPELVTGTYFGTLGISPALGRALAPDDDRPGAPAAVLISYGLWVSRFHGSPSVLGSTVRLGDLRFTVAGVMPKGYSGTLLDWGEAPVFWIPLAHIAEIVPSFASLDYRNRREVRWLMATVRLKRGVGVAAVQAALDTIDARSHTDADHRLVALPSSQARFFPSYREAAVRFLAMLAAVSAAVLAIACFNLANLLLAHVASREKETATRLALGARRGRIMRQFSIEGLVLTGGAAALGLPASLWLTGWLAGFPQFLAISLHLNLAPDFRVLLGSAATALLAGGSIGMVSAGRAGRANLVGGLNNATARPVAGGLLPGVRDLFVSAQVACAMVVLLSAVMLSRSLRDLETLQLGFRTHDTLLATVETGNSHRGPTDSQPFWRALLAELRAQSPAGAALVSEAIPGNLHWSRQVTAPGSAAPSADMEGNVVSEGFFAVAGMPIEAGREFAAADQAQAQPVVVLNRAAANLFWPGENPLGRTLRIAGEPAARVVVGVAADAQYHPLASSRIAYFFLPLGQSPRSQMTIWIRTPGNPLEYAGLVRQAVRRLDLGAPLYDIRTLDQQVASGYAQVRLAAIATSAVGLFGTVLAMAGVFAMTAWRVVRQRREIAIRMALGADHRLVVATLAIRGFAIGGLGAGVGAILTVWTTGLLRASLRGVAVPAPAMFLAAAVLLLSLVLAASIIPACRILRIDPARSCGSSSG